MDKIKRLAARLRGAAAPGGPGRDLPPRRAPRQPLLSEEMDIEYAGLAKEAAERIDNHFDTAGFVVAVLLESGMRTEARAVSKLLAGSEMVQAAKKLAEGTPYGERPTECKRCGSELRKGYCVDGTCPFSDHLQSDPEGWHGHPDRPTASRRPRGGAPPLEKTWSPLDKTWYCHGCGINASMRHPLRDAEGAATGIPACGSCGRPMTTEMPDQSWMSRPRTKTEGRTGQVETGPRPGTTLRDSMPWYCHDCGTSKRHPLAEGCPECPSCGRPMVSDRHLKD